MDTHTGARLLVALWPKINLTLSEQPRADRIRFIGDLLQCFAKNGVDLSQVAAIDEDIKLCVEAMGEASPRPKRSTGVLTIDTGGITDPIEYELVGGPFDGSAISLRSDLHEMPPESLALSSLSGDSRIRGEAKYGLQQVSERDAAGNEVSQYLAYEYLPSDGR